MTSEGPTVGHCPPQTPPPPKFKKKKKKNWYTFVIWKIKISLKYIYFWISSEMFRYWSTRKKINMHWKYNINNQETLIKKKIINK